MKAITVVVTGTTYEQISKEAQRLGTSPAALCSALLAERFEAKPTPIHAAEPRRSRPTRSQNTPPEAPEFLNPFDVAKHFPEAHPVSISLAQAFVDRALTYPMVIGARRNDHAIAIEENFVYVERLRLNPPGITVSFYGRPESLHDPAGLLTSGWGAYSRAKINNEEELAAALSIMAQAHALKFPDSHT